MEYIVMPADTFLVVNKTIMHDDDRLILTMLYEPIIGSMAISLYFTLWNYLDRKEVISSSLTHHYLMKSTHLSMEKIMEAKEVLEAISCSVYTTSPFIISSFFSSPG